LLIPTALHQDLGFSASDRAESVRRVGELACLMNDAGTITIVSLVSPYREDRDIARKRHEDQGLKFLEVFMDVPLDVVQDRDPKGLYKKVRACVCARGGAWFDLDVVHACSFFLTPSVNAPRG
jgi:adenylylsulfate kinase-like enzyme